ncbi:MULTISPECIES: TRC40/GET3/ArsA family transport-energizing ATPase [Brevibacterium]|uniref:Arsenite-transporting ATPase n=1 Tax=Brevibacterium antiquum CNRZ 918 TaxID=1255637 RepID=A0A2H1IBV5_9MICO|nr:MULTISPECIES: TRC40/GET3/ArsA family transport-energizing ATPase [Brevibacterium]SMX72691.1 arsenite-transporting ATPase [Brevibacterium antiquum CNRZ 918]HCG56898.1 arsenic-transporting ATPase [Brevibacterium sp.]
MLLDVARSRRLLFVGGKGGTGKTSVSSGLALARALDGGRVLLVSTDPAHNLGDIWQHKLSDAPSRVLRAEAGYVDAIEVDPQATIEAHFASVESMMVRMLPERTHTAVRDHLKTAKTAPGSHESAVLERIATITEDSVGAYDLVIFDTAPTGHTVHLLSLPERLTGWAETLVSNRDRSERFAAAARSLVSPKEETPGPDAQMRRTLLARRDRFALLRRTIADSQQTGFLITTLAERLPVAETLELVRQLRDLHVDLAGVVVNRRSPANAGDLLAARRDLEDRQLAELTRGVAPVPVSEVPLLAGELTGPEAVRQLADLLV